MRNGHRDQDQVHQKSVIPITVRQLEATIRISESLAKMQLLPFATEKHVAEALRLFQVSTLEAAQTGDLAGAEGFTTEEEHQMLTRIEKQASEKFANLTIRGKVRNLTPICKRGKFNFFTITPSNLMQTNYSHFLRLLNAD